MPRLIRLDASQPLCPDAYATSHGSAHTTQQYTKRSVCVLIQIKMIMLRKLKELARFYALKFLRLDHPLNVFLCKCSCKYVLIFLHFNHQFYLGRFWFSFCNLSMCSIGFTKLMESLTFWWLNPRKERVEPDIDSYNITAVPSKMYCWNIGSIVLWVRSPLKEKEVEQRGRTRDKQKRRQEERTGDNYMHKHFIFRCIMSSCCEPHWLCVLWARDNEPAG